MKTVLTIIKKEFARFFKDARLWITAILLPGLLIFAVYSIMGSIITSVQEDEAARTPTAVVINMPQSQSAILSSAFELKEETVESATEKVKSGALDLLIIFPINFDELIAEYSPAAGIPAPNVEIYYDSSNTQSFMAYSTAEALLSAYEDTIANKFDVNRPSADSVYDLATPQSTSRMILSMIAPMILLMLLFSGCMAVAPESIAGEKERGTIATLLVTPVKRSYVAIGKIAALSVIALLSGLSSCLGLVFSLPKLVGGSGGLTFSMFGIGDYAALFGVVLSTVLVLVALIAIISAFAKSVKEASGLVVPVMLLTMLCGVFAMFANVGSSIGLFFIPIFNSALLISWIMSGTVTAAAIVITVCMNLAFAALLVFCLTLMFKSEKVMFNR